MLSSSDVRLLQEAVDYYKKNNELAKNSSLLEQRLSNALDELVQFENDWEEWNDNYPLNEHLENEFEKY